jgi:molybdenum cofactor synthesis domain-containing protein
MLARIELLVVGNELLNGRTLDTNTHWMCKQLYPRVGIVRRKTTIPDDKDEVVWCVREVVSRAPAWLIVCGGLGPTYDDMTSEGIAKALNRPLHTNLEAKNMLQEFYGRKGLTRREVEEPSRVKMAKMPRGSKPIRNPVGAAPGIFLIHKQTKIVSLPGVPKELKAMFTHFVLNKIEESLSSDIVRRFVTVETRGVWESDFAPHLKRIMKRFPGIYIKSNPTVDKNGVSVIKFDIFAEQKHDKLATLKLAKGVEFLSESVRKLGGTVVKPLSKL